LPRGNLILVDKLGGRVFSLATTNGRPAAGPVDLHAWKMGAAGLADAGPFRLDPAKGELSDAKGHVYPVEMDYSRGAIRILRGGTLVVKTQPAARVSVDGRAVGTSPLKLPIATGKHLVRVEAETWVSTQEVEVLPARTVTLTLQP